MQNAPTMPSPQPSWLQRIKLSEARFFSYKPSKWLALSAIPLVMAVSFFAVSASTVPSTPRLDLATVPLYAAVIADKPTMALALSVEYPTVGAQYRDSPYSNTNEYLGYYDAEACYNYNNAPVEIAKSSVNYTDYRRFDRIGAAISRKCADAYSGNFLNWASSSAIDMLRLALSGGDRVIDTADTTNSTTGQIIPGLSVLQRAMLPNADWPLRPDGSTTDNPCYWNNGSHFPAKTLSRNGGDYFGAVPSTMRTTAGTNDIWIANKLNRIYFRAGSASAGSCTDSSGYTLQGSSSTLNTAAANSFGTVGIRSFSGSRPADTVNCSASGATCIFNGIQEVWFGSDSKSKWRVAEAYGSVACNTTPLGDPASGATNQCYTRINSGITWVPTDGFLYARVNVCNRDATTGALLDVRDYGLCTRYPNGGYKPVGVVQKYSDQIRLAAFGYLMDQTASYNTNGRYGGVLRAPMKYVGAKTFDINGNDSGTVNLKAEWDVNTGIFKDNPEGDTQFGKSGVINYLNKFGRTGPIPGQYKQFDPVGELYYETLRYLQGLPPSDNAVNSGVAITTAMKDGFPIYTDWSDATGVTDPYGGGRSSTANYSCQKNNIVVIGDVNTHEGGSSKFPSTNLARNFPDRDSWTKVVNAFEKGSSRNYTDGQGASRTTSNPNTFNTDTRIDGNYNLFTGYAYWAHTQDIRGTSWTQNENGVWGPTNPDKRRPGLRAKSFFFDANENSTESVAAKRRYGNQFFTAAKYGGFESDPNAAEASGRPKAFNTFGNPFKQNVDSVTNNDIWQKPSDPGEASTYYLQSNARGVLSAFEDIFKRATNSARSIAGGAVQSKNLQYQVANTIYQGTFDTSDWSGDLLSIPVSVAANNTVTIGTTNNWTAATKLGLLGSPETSRNIVMGASGATASPTATDFAWGSVGTTMQGILNTSPTTSTADTLGEERLLYLRGKRALEGSTFRLRNKLLGDIVNSGVAFSGKPLLSITSPTYNTFVASVNSLNSDKGRVPTVFVGANDGMLHAFDATALSSEGFNPGKELFAYIPSWMGTKLAALTSPNYVNNHQAYVDAPPVVAEALTGQSPDVWKTVLVSGTGAGGRGVFALDVTNPAAFDASKVMWEFTHQDDVDMGFVVGRPQIVKMRTNNWSSTTPTYRWFAAVPSGVNNYKSTDGPTVTTGAPTLFLLALDKAAGVAWANGTNYYKINLPINDTTLKNGLVNFSSALGSTGEVRQMYMGDLQGNLWKMGFDRVSSPADWNMTMLSPFTKGSTPAAYPLYIARDASLKRQPISMAPNLIRGNSQDSTYVAFGTGQYLEADDKTTTTSQSIYAVFDSETNVKADDPTEPSRESVINGRDRLSPGAASLSTGVVTVPAFVWGRPPMSITNLSTTKERAGWYFDLPNPGERQISNARSIGDYLIFGSLIPGSAGSATLCMASGGSGVEYTVNIDTGNGTSKKSTVGIMGEPLVMEIASSITYSQADNTGRRRKSVITQTIQQGHIGLGSTTAVTTNYIVGRLNWRQINNYQDLKASP